MRLKHSRLTHNQTNRLIEHFVAGTPARTASALIGVNKDTAATFYHRLRTVIAENLAAEAGELAGEVEVDESYFGGVRKGVNRHGNLTPLKFALKDCNICTFTRPQGRHGRRR